MKDTRSIQLHNATPAKPEEPPDPGALVKDRIWKWLTRTFGARMRAVIFVTAAIILTFLLPHISDLRIFGPAGYRWILQHRPLPIANSVIFTVALVPPDNDENGPKGT